MLTAQCPLMLLHWRAQRNPKVDYMSQSAQNKNTFPYANHPARDFRECSPLPLGNKQKQT